jgi:hypothetical protein
VAEFLGLAGSKFKVRVSSICRGPPPEVEFLEEIQTEVLRVFLLAIHRHLY